MAEAFDTVGPRCVISAVGVAFFFAHVAAPDIEQLLLCSHRFCRVPRDLFEELRSMRTARYAYEKPSRLSQAIVACLSVAVVLMAGWLAFTVLVSRYATTASVEDAEPVTSAPAYVVSVVPEPDEPGSTEPMSAASSQSPESTSIDFASATAAPPRSVLSLAPLVAPPVAQLAPIQPFPSVTAVPDASYRGISSVEPAQTRAPIEPSTPAAAPPSLPPKPARTASVPVPRPRPQIETEDVQPVPDQSLLEVMFGRQR
jgi:cytoskeletal protein RodZ